MNDSMTRLIKPLITCICTHFRQTNQICSKLFFLNQSKHILIFIQELCIYKTITFYDSSLVIKKKLQIFFFRFFFLPSCSLLAPHRLRTTGLEHTNMIWNQIQAAKKDGRDLHVVFLDLANAFGSVPHNLLWIAFHYFSVPEAITRLVKSYFQDLQLCLTIGDCTTAWQRVEIGIMAGCTISPLAFTMAMEVIIRASRWVVGGHKLKSGLRLPPIRAYMDDMTILTTTKACARRLLNKLQENIQWAQMEIKPSKSRSISIVKGKLSEHRFYVGEEPIPTVAEKPVKSLGRWYHATLKDSEQVDQLRQDTMCGLESINKTMLPGRLKLWCLQFGLLPRLMWPLTIYEVPISKVEKLERVVSKFAKKWLGLYY